MAAAYVERVLKDLIFCPVCSEEFSNKTPRLLSCLHVVCEECLQNLYDKKKATSPGCPDGVDCPVCQYTTALPTGQAASLPFFFHCLQIESARKGLEERHTICLMCEADEHKPEVCYYCLECDHGMCENCHAGHDKRFPDHTKISVIASTLKSLLCPEHDVPFKYFCKTCSVAVCSKCCITGHDEHEIYDLTYDDKKVKDRLRVILESALESADAAMERVNVQHDEVSNSFTKQQDDMKKHYDDALRKLNEEFTSLCAKLKQKQDCFNENVRESKTILQEARKGILELMEQTASWQEPIKGIPGFRITKIDELALEVENKLPSTDVKLKQLSMLMFQPGSVSFGQLTEQATEHTSGFDFYQADSCNQPRQYKLKYKVKKKDGKDSTFDKKEEFFVQLLRGHRFSGKKDNLKYLLGK